MKAQIQLKKTKRAPLTFAAVTSVALGLRQAFPETQTLIRTILQDTVGLTSPGRVDLPVGLVARAQSEFGLLAAVADTVVVALAWGHLGRMVSQDEAWIALEDIGVRVFAEGKSLAVVVAPSGFRT